MAKLEKSRKSWERRIWDAVVAYVNADNPARHKQDFEKLVVICLDWIGADESDMESCRDLKGTSLDALAGKYRPEIARVLTWLSDPVAHQDVAGHAGEFLRKLGGDITMHVDGNARFKHEEDPLVHAWPDHIGSVITPVCKFILDQIERHDVNGEPLRDVIPIGQCDWKNCTRFFVIERVGRARYCSGLCRANANQTALPKEVRAARMRKYRQGVRDRAAAKQSRSTKKKGAA